MSKDHDSDTITQAELTTEVKDYYNAAREDRNLLLSGETGIVNHHFGIGDFPRNQSITSFPQAEITRILNDMEVEQIEVLINAMGNVRPHSRVLDAGCGRGGTAFLLAQKYNVQIDAITIADYQKEFAEKLSLAKKFPNIKFYLMNYLQLSFPENTFDHIITNESTMYVTNPVLSSLFEGFHRVLKSGGRYTLATWCINEKQNNPYIVPIDKNYDSVMHTINEYLDALSKYFKNIKLYDMTADATPYWELRRFWDEKSGIEDAFYKGHTERKILYLYITAEKK